MEVDDRISYLEQRLQLQEDEIQVLKAALADVLRRLSTCEENGLSLQKRGPGKGMGEDTVLPAGLIPVCFLLLQRVPWSAELTYLQKGSKGSPKRLWKGKEGECHPGLV